MDSVAEKSQDRMIGRYHLTRLLGRGGSGEVWQATDTHLGRQVAIKLLPVVNATDRNYLDEFVTETRTSAMLEHPHILALHDFGQEGLDDKKILPYLVMPYVDGGTLRKRMQVSKGVLSVERSLYFLRQAALAIDFAHERGVLHRDIKPENMLLQQDWLLLADFGLAKILSSSSVHGKTHTRSGTPGYMAPERLRGNVEAASDLYSLAVIAYELFAGRRPYIGENPYQIFVQQLQTSPPEPREFNANIPLAVEHVLLQGLAKKPTDRPDSCNAFVDALQQGWGQAALAQNDTDTTQLAPWSKRWQVQQEAFPAPSTPVLSNMPSMSEALPTSVETIVDTNATAISKVNISDLPTPSEASLLASFPKMTQRLGRRQMLIGGSAVAALAVASVAGATLFYQHRAPAAQPPQPGPKKLISGVPLLSLNGHTDAVWVTKWHPSGRYLVTAGKDGYIMLWDIAAALRNQATVRTVSVPARKWTLVNVKFENTNGILSWSPDGTKLIAPQTFGDKVYVLDAFGKTNTPVIYSDQINANIGALTIYLETCPGPLKDHFTVASENFVQIWRMGQTSFAEKTLFTEKKLNLSVAKMNWSHDGSRLAALVSGDDDHLRVALWSNNQPNARIIPLPARSPHDTFFRLIDTIAWSPINSNQLLISNADIAVVADFKKQQLVLALGIVNNKAAPVISGMSWSPNGRYIASSYDGLGDNNTTKQPNPYIYIWDTVALSKKVSPTSKSIDVLPPTLSFGQQGALRHNDTILDVQWSPDGRYLATCSTDHKVIIWQIDGAR
jgi:serine/threonine protein kinase